MAIFKAITDNKGQVTSYHRIIAFAPVFVGESPVLNVNLASYTSEQYRDIERSSGESTQVSSTGVTLPLREDDAYTRANVYEAIMALPGWEDSTAV